ncbi:FAD binding domain-containing protein [Candidatus Bipolaricaulota bacterium]|nr:FAD binding domain-containing protein [Candidatus Bipolaricaulota bacterium]
MAGEFLRPADIKEAIALLHQDEERASIVGGGIEIVLGRSPAAERLIDLSRLGLSYIVERKEGLVIGATTTIAQIIENPLTARFLNKVIVEGLRQVGSPLIRNLATIGGAIARAHPWSDVTTLFLALGGTMVIYDGEEERTLSLSALYERGFRRRLAQMIITEIILPSPPAGAAAVFIKFSRTAFDIALLNCACFIFRPHDCIEQARIIIGARPQHSVPVSAVEEFLAGRDLTDSTIREAAMIGRETVHTADDIRTGKEYRKTLVAAGIRRTLTQIMHQWNKER